MAFTGPLTTASFNQPAPKELRAGPGQQELVVPVDDAIPAGAKVVDAVWDDKLRAFRVIVELPKT